MAWAHCKDDIILMCRRHELPDDDAMQAMDVSARARIALSTAYTLWQQGYKATRAWSMRDCPDLVPHHIELMVPMACTRASHADTSLCEMPGCTGEPAFHFHAATFSSRDMNPELIGRIEDADLTVGVTCRDDGRFLGAWNYFRIRMSEEQRYRTKLFLLTILGAGYRKMRSMLAQVRFVMAAPVGAAHYGSIHAPAPESCAACAIEAGVCASDGDRQLVTGSVLAASRAPADASASDRDVSLFDRLGSDDAHRRVWDHFRSLRAHALFEADTARVRGGSVPRPDTQMDDRACDFDRLATRAACKELYWAWVPPTFAPSHSSAPLPTVDDDAYDYESLIHAYIKAKQAVVADAVVGWRKARRARAARMEQGGHTEAMADHTEAQPGVPVLQNADGTNDASNLGPYPRDLYVSHALRKAGLTPRREPICSEMVACALVFAGVLPHRAHGGPKKDDRPRDDGCIEPEFASPGEVYKALHDTGRLSGITLPDAWPPGYKST
jgi:hypothetical protein